MANAGCINAYNCNGCLIQTLQNLDSACIGVGVQYTAPNPLDDKKIDYIKYTDKCGCSCTLTGENEILIYATDGVIKNLTLTNDDTNEAVVVKWNDIFGSNRAKTVVRYKTGSAPVSPTDGTLAVEETTKNQYSTNGFSVTGLSDSTTYYFTAFAIAQDDTMINVQTKQITTDFFVPGYQKLNYIQSTGTQYINTGFSPSNKTKVVCRLSADDIMYGSGQYGQYQALSLINARGYYAGRFKTTNSSNQIIQSTVPVGTVHDFENSQIDGFYIDGTKIGSYTQYTFTESRAVYLFTWNGTGGNPPSTPYTSGTLYYLKIYENGTLVRDFVPAKRKSDGVVGLMDLKNTFFYTNAGSGTFNYG